MKNFIVIVTLLFLCSCSRVKDITKDIPVVYTPDAITDSTEDYTTVESTPECADLIMKAIDSVAHWNQAQKNAQGDSWRIKYEAVRVKDKQTGDSLTLLRYRLETELSVQPKKDSTSIKVKIQEVVSLSWFENLQLNSWWGAVALDAILALGVIVIIRKRA
jgi:hypothetical protein